MRLRVLSVVIIAVACRGPAPARGQGADDNLRVPAGCHVSVFAQNLRGVRYLALGPGKMVYASQPGSGVIVKLPDSNHDGVAENAVTVASGLRGPFGIAFRADTMYVAEESDVKRFDPAGAAPVTIVPNVPGGGHSTRTILFGPDGKLYLAVGSSCNPNPEYGSADCSRVEPPTITMQAHSAPLGLAFYTGAEFPREYRGDAFVTLHGSWNRSVPTGAKVVRVEVDSAGRRAVGVEDFIVGWQRPDGSRWGRPVGLLVLPGGSLLVSDDMGGKIWRVSYGR